jgi:DNA-binding transcriptional LysR family regulator
MSIRNTHWYKSGDQMDKLNGVTVFVEVAEARSFVAAGRALSISASAVGKSISRLEERLNVKLFHRNTRSIHPTPEGALFLDHCRRILNEIEHAENELSQVKATPSGRLRISLPLVGNLLMSSLSSFMTRYPKIELELDFTDRVVDVIDEGFDVVIRTGELSDSVLVSRRLGSFRMVVVGAPSYLAKHGVPRAPVDLAAHACLHYKLPTSGRLERWPIDALSDEYKVRLPVTMACNNIATLVHMAREGCGIACLPDFAVRGALSDGSLETVLDEHTHSLNAVWILWPSNRYESPKLRAFIDHLTGSALASVDLGAQPVTGRVSGDRAGVAGLGWERDGDTEAAWVA